MSRTDGAHRTLTMKGVPQARGTVTSSAGRVQRANANMSIYNTVSPGNAVMGPGRPRGPLPTIQSFQGPDVVRTLKRRGVDGIFENHGTSRQRVDLAGNSAGQLRRMAGTALGTNMQAPQFGQGAPTLARFQRGPEGLPIGSGFPSKPDPFIRGQLPTRPRGEGGIAWGGMPAKPTVFDHGSTSGRVSAGLRNTQSSSQFPAIGTGTGANDARQNPPNPFTSYDYDGAASQVQDGTKTGRPNALVKYTYILTHEAALYAQYTQAAFPWFAPIKLIRKDGRERQGVLGWKAPDPLHDGFNLPTANYMLACLQTRPDKFEDVMTVEYVLDHWKFSGVIAAEHGETFSRFTDANNATGAVARKVIPCQQGEVDCYNFWGNVAYGQEVGFIIKGVPARHIWAHNYREHGTYNIDATSPESFVACNLLTHSNNPLQLIPWFSEGDGAVLPSDTEKAYYDHLGVKHFGKYFKIGVVIQEHQVPADEHTISRAPFSAVAAINCGKIRILVDAYKDV